MGTDTNEETKVSGICRGVEEGSQFLDIMLKLAKPVVVESVGLGIEEVFNSKENQPGRGFASYENALFIQQRLKQLIERTKCYFGRLPELLKPKSQAFTQKVCGESRCNRNPARDGVCHTQNLLQHLMCRGALVLVFNAFQIRGLCWESKRVSPARIPQLIASPG